MGLHKWAAEVAAQASFSAPFSPDDAGAALGGLPVPHLVVGTKADISGVNGGFAAMSMKKRLQWRVVSRAQHQTELRPTGGVPCGSNETSTVLDSVNFGSHYVFIAATALIMSRMFSGAACALAQQRRREALLCWMGNVWRALSRLLPLRLQLWKRLGVRFASLPLPSPSTTVSYKRRRKHRPLHVRPQHCGTTHSPARDRT